MNPVLSLMESPLAGKLENLAQEIINRPVVRTCGLPTCDTPLSKTLDEILAEHELPNELPLADGMSLLVDAPYDGVNVEDRGLYANIAPN